MVLPLPNLDDLKYEELVDEARSLITGFCPEWTDHNPTDPGMTLIEMFAWLSEMLVYRTNQIPEQHQLSFLRLINGPSADGSLWQPSAELDEEIRDAITTLRERYRTVTNDDYEVLLLELSDFVARTKCVPLRNLSLGTELDRASAKSGHVSLLFVPVAPFDSVLKFNSTTVAYEEYTSMASIEDATVFSLTSEQADILYLGLVNQRFDGIDFLFDVMGSGYALEIEYFSETTSWTSLTVADNRLMDASWNWSQEGSIWFAAPMDWVVTDIEGISAYWVRISTTSTSVTVARAKKIVPRLLQPSATLIDQLETAMEPRRLLTTRQHIVGPIYAPIGFDMLVASRTDVRADELRKDIINSLIVYLDPLTGGAEGTGWPFGRAVYISELYALLESIPGVDYLPDMYLSSQCDAGAARCVNAAESWHDNGEFIGLELAAHHLPQVNIEAERIIIAERFMPVQVSIEVSSSTGVDDQTLYRRVKSEIKKQFHPLYSNAATGWQNNSWHVDRADLVTVLEDMPEVDENQAVVVKLQDDPNLERVTFAVLTLADVTMKINIVTGI